MIPKFHQLIYKLWEREKKVSFSRRISFRLPICFSYLSSLFASSLSYPWGQQTTTVMELKKTCLHLNRKKYIHTQHKQGKKQNAIWFSSFSQGWLHRLAAAIEQDHERVEKEGSKKPTATVASAHWWIFVGFPVKFTAATYTLISLEAVHVYRKRPLAGCFTRGLPTWAMWKI